MKQKAAVPRGAPTTARIKALALTDPAGCWVYQARIDKHGYGHIRIAGKMKLAHRASYEAFTGKIPDGMTIDHKCKNTRCVNPEHLRLRTMSDNARDNHRVQAQLARTHCIHGHEYTPANTQMSSGSRKCRTCIRLRVAKASGSEG